MKPRSISDDDQCGGCKYRIMADTPDDGDRCVHDFVGVTQEDEDGTIKTCSDFERPTRVIIIGGVPTSAATVAALVASDFSIVVEAGAGKVNGLTTDVAFFDESTTIKASPRLGMPTPKFYGRDGDGILAQHQNRWREPIRDLEPELLRTEIRELTDAEWAAIGTKFHRTDSGVGLRPKWGASDLETAMARAKLDSHYSAENHRRIIAGLDEATERMTGLHPEHGMPYVNPLGPQPMKPKPIKAKARAKKRARIAAQSRRRNRK